MLSEEESRIENLKKALYSRVDRTGVRKKAFKFHDVEDPHATEEWHEKEELADPMVQKKGISFINKLLLFSVMFFAGCLFVGGYIFFGGGNVVSGDQLDIDVAGPVAIAGGDELVLDVVIKNRNNTPLEFADLHVAFPDGTRSSTKVTEQLKRYEEQLGELRSGQTLRRSVHAILFGEEHSVKDITVTIDYRLKGSSATFEKTKKVSITISSAPVTLTISSVKEINSNQKIELTVDIKSNSTEILRHMLLNAEYPFGFKPESATPKADFDGHIWDLGDLASGAKKTIKIMGTIQGQDGEERTFRFSTGSQGPGNSRNIEPVFLTSSQSIVINKPFISAELALSGSNAPVVVSNPGNEISGELMWANNLPGALTNAELSIKLDGAIIDQSGIKVEKGYYRSSDKVIVWDQTTNDELRTVEQGAQGILNFTLKTLPVPTDRPDAFKNSQITLSVSMKGRRGDESQVPETVVGETKTIKIMTGLNLSAQTLYQGGPFTNTGPVPPKVNTETLYTVVWTLTNSINDVDGTTVTARLPNYVKWLGVVSPSSEKVAWSSENGTLTWNVGDVPASTGYTKKYRQVSFQVSFTPSVSQFDTIPILIGEATVNAHDRFADALITTHRGALTTNVNSSGAFTSGGGKVTQ